MDVLNELFKKHDEYSWDCAFNEDDMIRLKMFYKAEALREVVQAVEDSIKDESERKMFGEKVLAHYKAMSQMLFYHRRKKE